MVNDNCSKDTLFDEYPEMREIKRINNEIKTKIELNYRKLNSILDFLNEVSIKEFPYELVLWEFKGTELWYTPSSEINYKITSKNDKPYYTIPENTHFETEATKKYFRFHPDMVHSCLTALKTTLPKLKDEMTNLLLLL